MFCDAVCFQDGTVDVEIDGAAERTRTRSDSVRSGLRVSLEGAELNEVPFVYGDGKSVKDLL